MRDEYSLDVGLDTSPYDTARWVSGDDADLEKLVSTYRNQMATDRDGAPVFLAKSAWELGYVAEKFKTIRFAKTRERHEVHASD
jgi:peptide chain release factor 3